jgi:hypothetical protein
VGDLDEGEARRLTSDPGTAAVAAMLERRVGQGIRVREVAWAARSGCTVGVVTLEALADRITNVRMVLNPEKLSLWN